VNDHTYLLRPGRWEISGSTIDVAGNPNFMIGFAVVTHEESWTIEEQLNENPSRYSVTPPAPGEHAAIFNGHHAILGNVQGGFALFDDIIVSTYRSDDGQYVSSEVFRRIEDDNYECKGALYLNGGHVSSWTLLLHRASA
jgi:hypothetical protein